MAKNIKRIIFVLILLAALLSVGFLMMTSTSNEYQGRDMVARIYLYGPIQEGTAGYFTGAITPGQVARELEQAKNEGAQAVVLRIDSPGGAIAASQEIASTIRNYNLPVVISMGDTAASGGYYISAPADGIVAHPGTMTGSIGVISQSINPAGLLEKLGIEMETFTAGEHKDMSMRDMTEQERNLMQEMLNQAYDQFVEEIAEGRELDKEEVLELATGEVFIGSQAYELGLVDRLGGMDEALSMAAELAELADPVYFDLSSPGLFEQFRLFSTEIFSIISRFTTPDEILILENIETNFKPVFEYRLP